MLAKPGGAYTFWDPQKRRRCALLSSAPVSDRDGAELSLETLCMAQS